MAIPPGGFSSTPQPSALLAPDSRERVLTEDFERGGVALNDPSHGYDVRDWMARTDGAEVWVAPWPEEAPRTVLHAGSDITEVTLAFDQNMQPILAWVEGGLTRMRWYDSAANAGTGGFVVTSFVDCRCPFLTMDDKRAIAAGTNDIILAYIRDEQVRYRQQRERFTVEYTLGPTPSQGSRILKAGMGLNGRLQFKISVAPSARHHDIKTDTLYLVTGEDLVKLGGGPLALATWRSRTFVADEVPGLPWARVEATGYPLLLRVLGDGQVRAALTVRSNAPFRLPAGMWREWAVEVEGLGWVVELQLASSEQELEG
jgi:hypothetical protein